jgi:trans-2,3-dihydro-3-hydroxyanthranilate isomerase
MKEHHFRIVNVFTITGDSFSGNPLCVFEDGRGLSDVEMQALALQFNLSETTFILPSDRASARVRIFTPMFEMPFAGHPILGTAHVLRALTGGGDRVTLDVAAGIVPVVARADVWSLEARAPRFREVEATPRELAEMLALDDSEVLSGARWVDTGSEQLVVPLASPSAVARCNPSLELLRRHGRVHETRHLTYVFADAGQERVSARFFFAKGTSVVEDPATGSACANLGGFYLASHAELPLRRTVFQGGQVRRPSRLELEVDGERRIHVRGGVMERGRGVVDL